jgi:hypothetical protein
MSIVFDVHINDQSLGEREHHCSGLVLITNHLRNELIQHVLDLGSAITSNIEFLAGLQCKMYVEHLTSLLYQLITPATDEPRSFDQLLPYAGEFHFDVVFAWDLLNYLEPPYPCKP